MKKIIKSLKIMGNTFYILVIVFLVVVAIAISMSVFKLPGGFRLYTVQSGSMVPALKTGSIAIDREVGEYKVGDIITFSDPKDSKSTITHRVVEIKEADSTTKYVTKGDANNAPDAEERPKQSVLGKVILSIPYAGYPVAFAKTQTGFLVLIIIPATILVYSELMNIKKELTDIFKKRNDKKNKKEEKTETIA